jgi:DNA helicase-2/ATP-dependent DNA helicase PcrA
VELVTVHGAKGREWQTVVVLGMEEERFPNRRALVDAADPDRAVEEERRLAYVALTRATRCLILAFDPARPSRFLVEMGLLPQGSPRRG